MWTRKCLRGLYSNVFTTPGPLDLFIDVPYGVTATLDILLESAADVVTGGSAFNAASVTFGASVPRYHLTRPSRAINPSIQRPIPGRSVPVSFRVFRSDRAAP